MLFGNSYKKFIIRINLGCVLMAGLVAPGLAQNPDPNFHIYLGLGQSNMEGGPSVSGLPAANPRFQVLSVVNCPNLNPPRTMGQWYTANPPLPRCTQGPGIVDWFGRTLVDSLPANIKVGVLMVTVVGTKIELFDKDEYQTYLDDPTTADWLRNYAREYGGNPYGRLIEMAKIAKQAGIIRGILVHQGESNAGDSDWPNKMKKIYGNIMTDLALDPKDIPLLAGEVVNADVGGTAASANVHIAKLPSVLPNSYVISSSQLPAGRDSLHFTADGHKAFGKRYATTMLSILRQPTSVQLKRRLPEGFIFSGVKSTGQPGWAEIQFELTRRSVVSLKAYSLNGQAISEIAGKVYSGGPQKAFLKTLGFGQGLYFIKMQVNGFSETRTFFIKGERPWSRIHNATEPKAAKAFWSRPQ
jgi:hypothetical protein